MDSATIICYKPILHFMMFNGEPGILGAVICRQGPILQQAVFGAEQYGLRSNDDTPNSRQPQGRPFGSAFERIGWVEENIALIMPPWLPGVASLRKADPCCPGVTAVFPRNFPMLAGIGVAFLALGRLGIYKLLAKLAKGLNRQARQRMG